MIAHIENKGGLKEGLLTKLTNILDITLLNIDYIAKNQVREFLGVVNAIFDVIDGSNEMIGDTLKIDNNDLEDNLQYAAALNSKCDYIMINDKILYTKDIFVLNAKEFYKGCIN